jgi:hypothetical protein
VLLGNRFGNPSETEPLSRLTETLGESKSSRAIGLPFVPFESGACSHTLNGLRLVGLKLAFPVASHCSSLPAITHAESVSPCVRPCTFAARSGIFPHAAAHLRNLEKCGGPGGLTCLSVGCLSSYLIFPPVPVTSKQGRNSRGTQRREARLTCAPPLISIPIA